MISFRYAALECRRGIKMMWHFAGKLILAALVFAMFAAGIAFVLYKAGAISPLQVGVVIPDDNEDSRVLIQYLFSTESVKSICSFSYMEEDEAGKLFEEDELQAVILLSEDFYNDVDSGENTPVRVLIRQTSDNRGLLFGEVLNDGVSFLRTAEAGIYAMDTVMKTEHSKKERSEISNALLYEYVTVFFNRNTLFAESMLSSLGELTLAEFDFIGLFLTVLLFCGLGLGGFYEKQSRALEMQLGIYGLRGMRLALIRILVFTVLLYMAELLIYVPGCVLSSLLELDFVRFSPQSMAWLILPAFSMAALFHLLYILAGEAQTGKRILLAVGVLMVVASGILVPSAYLPSAVAGIGYFTPLAAWARCVQTIFFGGARMEFVICAAVGILGLTVSEVIAWRNT